MLLQYRNVDQSLLIEREPECSYYRVVSGYTSYQSQSSVRSPQGLGYILTVLFQDKEGARPICIKSVFPVLLSLLNILTTKIVYRTLYHNHFSFLPVHLKVVFLKLDEAKDEVLLIQTRCQMWSTPCYPRSDEVSQKSKQSVMCYLRTQKTEARTTFSIRIKDGELVSFHFSSLIESLSYFLLTLTLLSPFFSFSYLKLSKRRNKMILHITVIMVTGLSHMSQSQSQCHVMCQKCNIIHYQRNNDFTYTNS